MTRRDLFRLAVLPIFQVGQAERAPIQKWYIVGGHTEDALGYRNDCIVPPIVSYGRDIIEALTNSGMTVMTAEHYFQNGDFQKTKECLEDRKRYLK